MKVGVRGWLEKVCVFGSQILLTDKYLSSSLLEHDRSDWCMGLFVCLFCGVFFPQEVAVKIVD